MSKAFLKLVIIVLLAVCAHALEGKRRFRYIHNKLAWLYNLIRFRNQDRIFLRNALDNILGQSNTKLATATTSDLKHMIVKSSREEMFGIYDTFLAGNCSQYSDMDEKKSLVREAWKILGEFLFRLDKTDMHNACYMADIQFPSVIYD